MQDLLINQNVHHAASALFTPEAYTLIGIYDLGDKTSAEQAKRDLHATHAPIGSGYMGKCGHCGQNIRYAALLFRKDVGETIFVGEQCLDNRFEGTHQQFRELHEAAAVARAKKRLLNGFLEACEKVPALAYATYARNIAEGIGQHDLWAIETMGDIAYRARKHGRISPKQEVFVEKLVDGLEATWKKIQAQEAQDAAAADVPDFHGKRAQITGTVLSIKTRDGGYGPVTKMLVRHEDGWKVWGSVPTSIVDAAYDQWKEGLPEDANVWDYGPDCWHETLKGQQVTFTAKVEVSDNDPKFGFFKRPTAAAIVTD